MERTDPHPSVDYDNPVVAVSTGIGALHEECLHSVLSNLTVIHLSFSERFEGEP